MNRSLWALALCGCGSSATGPAGQPAAFVQSDTQDPTTIKPANLACLGTHSDPAGPSADTPVTMTVQDFELSTPVANAVVEVYYTLDHVNAKTPDVTSAPTGADGKTTVTITAGAPYRVIFRTTADPQQTIETVEFNRAYSDPLRNSVSTATKSVIEGVVSVVADATKGVVAGDLRDCDDARVGGVTLAVTSTGGSYDAKANTFYFVDTGTQTVPARAQKWTSGNGVFASLNVPPGNATLTVSGLLASGGATTRLGTGLAPVRANSITVVQLEPLGP